MNQYTVVVNGDEIKIIAYSAEDAAVQAVQVWDSERAAVDSPVSAIVTGIGAEDGVEFTVAAVIAVDYYATTA